MKTYYQIILSLLTGILVCLSFPTLIAGIHFPEMGLLAWVALIPLVIAIHGAPPRRAFTLAFVAALVWFSGSIFWVYRAMHTFGHLSAFTSLLVLILLVIILSAYVALAPMFSRIIEKHWRGEMIVLLPVSWTAIEILRNYVPFNGFPWSNVAMSQWRILPVIQIADVVGIYGIIFLIVWVNTFLAEVVLRLTGKDVRFFFPKCITTALLVIATILYGVYRLHSVPRDLSAAGTISVGLIQGNIPQDEKWEGAKGAAILDIYREGTRRLMSAPVELIIWPEASMPWPVEVSRKKIAPRTLGLPENLSTTPYTIFGAISEGDGDNYYNSAILVAASGEIVARYHKAHLVPFGEYIPYRRLFFFARKLTQPVGNFLAGDSSKPLVVGQTRPGILICYEDIFPQVSRKTVWVGANLLVNITNDAWYGVSSAPFQHLALSVFRAVENRRFLVRSTNTGVSAVVTPTGKVLIESDIFEPALIVSKVGRIERLSLYTRLGDWFAWGCLAYMILGIIAAIARTGLVNPFRCETLDF